MNKNQTIELITEACRHLTDAAVDDIFAKNGMCRDLDAYDLMSLEWLLVDVEAASKETKNG